MSQLRFGIVGAGRIAQAYVQAFGASEKAELVAASDVDATAAGALAEGIGGAAFGSPEEMLEKARPDAVVICSPPATHADIATFFLEAGVPVLCEKPLSINRESAERMVNTAARTGTPMTMASKFRYVDAVKRARSMVVSGSIGEIMLFENVFTGHVDMRNRWNSNPDISGGGVLIDNGTHSVDIMRYFLGPLRDIQAVEGRRTQGLTVDETVHLSVRSADGALGSIDLSWSMHKEQPTYIEIFGTEGVIRLGWRSSTIKRTGDDDWSEFAGGYDKVAAFRSQIDNFVGAIGGTEELRTTAADALASVAVVEAAYESLRRQNWVPIDG